LCLSIGVRSKPYEGKLSRTVLRREGAEQSALTQPTIHRLSVIALAIEEKLKIGYTRQVLFEVKWKAGEKQDV
jgi:hypothetical protein